MGSDSKKRGKWVQSIMLEENAGGCGLARALGHVSNTLALQRIGHQVAGQAAAGMFWPGDVNATNADYQIKFLADRIAYAPFWYAQRMLSESHQPHVLGGFHATLNSSRGGDDNDDGSGDHGDSTADDVRTSPIIVRGTHTNNTLKLSAAPAWIDWMAAVSDDGNTIVFRVENPNSVHVEFTSGIARGVVSGVASSIASNDVERTVERSVGRGAGRRHFDAGVRARDVTTTCRGVRLYGNSTDATNDFGVDAVVPEVFTVSRCTEGGVGATLEPYSFTVLTVVTT